MICAFCSGKIHETQSSYKDANGRQCCNTCFNRAPANRKKSIPEMEYRRRTLGLGLNAAKRIEWESHNLAS